MLLPNSLHNNDRFPFMRLLLLSCLTWAPLAVGHESADLGLPHDHPVAVPTNRVKITVEGDQRVIRSNGWPDHAPGEFPRRGNPNTISEQEYTFRMPAKPKPAAEPTWRGGWFFGVAVNGVPFEPGTGETWKNDRRSGWRYEAATGFLDLGLDEHHAHVQPTGAYHYHALPKGLVEKLGGDTGKMLLVGWAADGFPIYTANAHEDPKNGKSPLKSMKSSYRLRGGERPAEPQGPGGKYDGRFAEDFEFVQGAGDLDECNGRSGVTPEFSEGTYYYCITGEFPFIGRRWRGTPDPSFGKGHTPGGPGAGPPGARPDPLAGGGTAEAGPPPRMEPGPGGRPLPPVQSALDLNSDGIIDSAELRQATDSLKKLDKNQDGRLTPEELRPGRPPGF